jgi:hypothetical protein
MRPVPGYLISLRTRAGDRRKSDGVSVPAADPRWWSARCLGPVRGRGAGGETALPAHQTPLRPAHSRLARHRADRRRIRPCALSSDCCSSLPAQARLVTCAVLRRGRLDDQRWSGPRSPCRGRGLGRPGDLRQDQQVLGSLARSHRRRRPWLLRRCCRQGLRRHRW